MTIPILLLIIVTVIAVLFIRGISLERVTTMSELAKRRQSVEAKYDYLVRRKLELQSELTRKERQLTTMINSKEGIRIKSASELCISERDEDDRVSNLLIAMGKISVEQNEKVRQKMDVLKMDYLATCLTLGYIDAETSREILKNHIRPGK